jgi:flavin-dependent dehydrogenase
LPEIEPRLDTAAGLKDESMISDLLPSDSAAPSWDVIIVGGALSGAATACLLRRRNRDLRVLILERSDHFKRRVGESTVEVSAFFLGRVLGLTEHLLEHHLPKQGMRFWSMNRPDQPFDECSEIGPGYNVRLPGFQVDRAVLDEHVLAVALAEGAELRRPVRVRGVRLESGGAQTVEWEDAAGAAVTAHARWVVDASGVAALLARQEGWLRPNAAHPTAACWSRWTGVKSWEDRGVAQKFPAWAARCRGLRSVATNHLTGYGWWAWWIPLKGGDVSIGVVYDQRITALPPGPNLAARLRAMLWQHPAARELMADAVYREQDVHFRANLAYSSSTFATDGSVLVGDAAGFIDPLYSPGMDWISFTASCAAHLIDRSFRGEAAPPLVAQHNADFLLCDDHWFRALYQDKYYYLGDYELMAIAFRLDLGMYYLGVVQGPFTMGAGALHTPPFTRAHSELPFRFMALYNRRLAAIARCRQRRGVWGRGNARGYFPFTSYEFNHRLLPRVIGAAARWLALEVREGWRTWFQPVAAPAGQTAPLTPSGNPAPS